MIPKPAKGSTTALRRRKARQVKSYERAVMNQARERDGNCCRYCGKHPGEVAHMSHRGMGGNPSGSRTVAPKLLVLCKWHHVMYDAAQLVIDPLTSDGANGPLRFQLK